MDGALPESANSPPLRDFVGPGALEGGERGPDGAMKTMIALNTESPALQETVVPRGFDQLGIEPTQTMTRRPLGYSGRFPVPEDYRPWDVPFPQYEPNRAVSVLDEHRLPAEEALRYAASHEGSLQYDEVLKLPLNPIGRTGLHGKGELFRYGPNHAADAILLRGPDEDYGFQVLLIQRKDGSWGFPGGFQDRDESTLQSAIRELGEETVELSSAQRTALQSKAELLYEGYADDPRNTDNAWIETTAFLISVTDEEAEQLSLRAADDAKGVKWFPLRSPEAASLYGCHSAILQLARAELNLLHHLLLQKTHYQSL